MDTNPGTEAQQLLDKTVKWTERLYDMNEDEIYAYIHAQGDDENNTGNGSNGILYIEYSYLEIGRTREWFSEIAAKINDPLTVRREILLQRLHGSSLSPFSQEDIEYIISMEHKPIDEMWLLEFYRFDIYKKLDPRKPYIAGIDCATGTLGDNNAITLIDPFTIEPVAEFECNYIGETKFEKLIIELTRRLPRVVLCIERNSVGDGIVDHLLNTTAAPNLYYDKDKDLLEDTMRQNQTVESMLKKQGAMKKYYGVYTSGSSRDDMFNILARHVNEYKEKFITHNVIRDLSRLVRSSSGKILAGEGFHDDSIMSYLIGLYVRYHGNNLPLFGIILGATDEELDNRGTKRPEEIDRTLVDPKLIDAVAKEEKLQASENVYEEMLRSAIMKSQNEAFELTKRGLVDATPYDNTPKEAMDEYDVSDNIPLSFFDEVNNIGNFRGSMMDQGNSNNMIVDPFSNINGIPW